MSDRLVIRKGDDFHVHGRNGLMLKRVAPETARQFKRALFMPNTDPPITNGPTWVSYDSQIRSACDPKYGFEPLGTFKITPSTTIEDVESAASVGVIAGKLYPDGVTNNSEGGVRDFTALFPVFEAMQDLGLVLCLHGEHPDAETMDAEKVFVEIVLTEIVTAFPRLRIVLEHISTKAGVVAVTTGPHNLVGSVTAHHLELTHSDVLKGKLRPHKYCMPIPKWIADRDAILGVVMSGHPKFFFGSDSAPHLRKDKECADGCAGNFTARYLMELLATIFMRHGCMDKLEKFTSEFGANFYQLPLNEDKITLVKKETKIPKKCYRVVVPYRAGETLPWSLG